MSTGFSALRDYDICPSRDCFSRLRHCLHLTNQLSACVMDCRREWAWVAERQHDGGWSMGEDAVALGFLKAPSDEAAADPGIARTSPFPFIQVPSP